MSNLFDRFAKGVAEGVSRRDALKYLGGFLGGGFLTALAGKAGAIGCNTPIPAECTTYCATCPTSPRGVQNRCLQSCKLFYLLTGSVTTCAACTRHATLFRLSHESHGIHLLSCHEWLLHQHELRPE